MVFLLKFVHKLLNDSLICSTFATLILLFYFIHFCLLNSDVHLTNDFKIIILNHILK